MLSPVMQGLALLGETFLINEQGLVKRLFLLFLLHCLCEDTLSLQSSLQGCFCFVLFLSHPTEQSMTRY